MQKIGFRSVFLGPVTVLPVVLDFEIVARNHPTLAMLINGQASLREIE
jgi:hypothetical protein